MAEESIFRRGFAPSAVAGITLVVASAIAIAVIPSLAKFAYAGGTNVLTVITARSVVSIVVTAAVIAMLGLPFRLPRRSLMLASLCGVFYAGVLYGYLGAVAFLPVNLVILIYFVHPLLLGVVGAALGIDNVTLPMVGVLVLALVGLVLALGTADMTLSGRGLSLAMGAMVLTVFVILANAGAARLAPSLTVCFYMFVSAAVVLALPMVVTGSLDWPETRSGWASLLGVAVLFTFGTLTFFAGVSMIGATRAAMISILEPIFGVLFSIAMLSERLTAAQAVGVALVIGSIYAMEQLRART